MNAPLQPVAASGAAAIVPAVTAAAATATTSAGASAANVNLRVNTNGERIRAASLAINPRISQWLRFDADGMVEARPGKVEIGQGIVTALAQIVAEELDVDLDQVRMLAAATSTSPDEAVTSGSLSIQESGAALRQASAHARALFLDAAAAQLGVPRADLRIEQGRIYSNTPGGNAVTKQGGNTITSYAALASLVNLDIDASPAFTPKPHAEHRIVGSAVPRRDLPEKIFGTPRLIHDLVLPGMAHGRVVRPPAPGAQLVSAETDAIGSMPGVIAVVRDGSFLGVVADTETHATQAATQLEKTAQWRETRTLPDARQLPAWLSAQPVETKVVSQRGDVAGVTSAATANAGAAGDADASAAGHTTNNVIKATYSRGFVAHASIGPSCALARWRDDNAAGATGAGVTASINALDVWTHSQGIFNLRTDLALAFSCDAASITVHHAEGAGCYGHNGADDVAYDAALLARAVPGRAVRVQWTRAQELAWGPVSPAMRMDMEAALDADGNIRYWKHDVTSNGHGTRPGRAKTPALLAATHLEKPFEPLIAVDAPLANGGGGERNSVPLYTFPAWTITKHRLLTMPLRTSAMRSLGAHANVFALESFIDEIAHARGEDAVAFRLRQLDDPRARAVIERAAAMAGWHFGALPAASSASLASAVSAVTGTPGNVASGAAQDISTGRGIAFAKYKNTGAYCAVVAEVEVAREVRVKKFWIAVDVGLVINPDGVLNQVEGGAIQTASMTLKEAVTFDATRITSDAWERYPILTFSEVPEVEIDLISRPDCPSVGAGEAAHGPAGAAIGNAVFNAIGVRVRAMPMTPEQIILSMA